MARHSLPYVVQILGISPSVVPCVNVYGMDGMSFANGREVLESLANEARAYDCLPKVYGKIVESNVLADISDNGTIYVYEASVHSIAAMDYANSQGSLDSNVTVAVANGTSLLQASVASR